MNKPSEIAREWLTAFNAHDLESLLALYDDHAVHYSPKLKLRHPATAGMIRGKAALADWWQEALDRLPTLHYALVSLTANDDQVFMEYTRRVSDEEDMAVAEVLRIKDGMITSSAVYHG